MHTLKLVNLVRGTRTKAGGEITKAVLNLQRFSTHTNSGEKMLGEKYYICCL